MLGLESMSFLMSLRTNPFQDWLFCLPYRCDRSSDRMTHQVKDLILHRILDLRSCSKISCGFSDLPQLHAGVNCGAFCFSASKAGDPVRAWQFLSRPEEPWLTLAFTSTHVSHPSGNVGSAHIESQTIRNAFGFPDLQVACGCRVPALNPKIT